MRMIKARRNGMSQSCYGLKVGGNGALDRQFGHKVNTSRMLYALVPSKGVDLPAAQRAHHMATCASIRMLSTAMEHCCSCRDQSMVSNRGDRVQVR